MALFFDGGFIAEAVLLNKLYGCRDCGPTYGAAVFGAFEL